MTEVNVYRVLVGIGGVGMIFYGYIYRFTDPGAVEVLYDRYLMAVVCFIVLGLSYLKGIGRKTAIMVMELTLYVFTLVSLWLNYINHFDYNHQITLLIVIMAISIAFQNIWKLAVYLSLFYLLFAGLNIYTIDDTGQLLINLSVFFFMSGIIAVIGGLRITAQRRSKISEQYLRKILNRTVDGILLVDEQGIIIDSNERFLQIFKAKSKDVRGKAVRDFLVEPMNLEFRQKIIDKIRETGYWRGELECKDMTGRQFWTDIGVSIIPAKPSDLVLIRLTDISHLMEIEESLRASEERFALAVQGANDGIWDWDMRTNVVYFSPRYKAMLGYTDAEFPNQFSSWENHLHPEDVDAAISNLNGYLEGNTETYNVEFRMRHKEGYYIWVQARGKVLLDEAGKQIRMAGSHTDITDRKHYEELLQGVMNSTLNGIMSFGAKRNDADEIEDFMCSLVNEASAELLQRPMDELKGMSLLEMFPGVKPSGMFDMFRQVVEEDKPAKQEINYEFDNLNTWFQVMAVKLGDGFVVTFENISERKRAEHELLRAKEEAEAGARAKSDFLATMSHEIRTPMNAVIGMTGLLLESELTDAQRDFVETIRSSGDNLLAIINDILDYSKIDSGMLDLEATPFSLVDCVEDVSGLMSHKAAEKKLELLTFIDADVPDMVKGDFTRLTQVLINLVNNAIKFTEKGEILISVKKHKDDDELVEFKIKDTGIGINKDKISHLFEHFTQADSSTTRKYGGTGLGLAISKKLVELMEGDIWAESKVGEGSTFYFTARLPKSNKLHKLALNGNTGIKGKKVLLVDDNETNLKILELQCERWHMEATSERSAAKALEVLNGDGADHFDLAIFDMQMPDMNGVQLTEEVRKTYPKNELPIIMLSSLGAEIGSEDRELFDLVLTKPARMAQLHKAVVEVLGLATADDKRASELKDILEHSQLDTDIEVLLAEDNEVNQRVALSILNKMGFQPEIANNGAEVLEKMQETDYDLILMDVQMPEMDGLEASQKIRQEMNNDQVIIIAMTANAFKEDREKCLAAGMNDYISKPVKIEVLYNTLLKWFALPA